MPWMEASLSIRTMRLRRDVSHVIGIGKGSSDDALDSLLSGSLNSDGTKSSTDKLESTEETVVINYTSDV